MARNRPPALDAGCGMDPVIRASHLAEAPLINACPTCGAGRGAPCTSGDYHPERVTLIAGMGDDAKIQALRDLYGEDLFRARRAKNPRHLVTVGASPVVDLAAARNRRRTPWTPGGAA